MPIAQTEHKCFSCGYLIKKGDEEEMVPQSSKLASTAIRYRHATWQGCQQAAQRIPSPAHIGRARARKKGD